jgi:hypothetical protein
MGCAVNLLDRLTGADAGGTWTYLGFNTAQAGTPGAGGSTVGTLTGDNPEVDFTSFTTGFYSFQYCVGEGLCQDCITLQVRVTPSTCDPDDVDIVWCTGDGVLVDIFTVFGVSFAGNCFIPQDTLISVGPDTVDSSDINQFTRQVDFTGYGAGTYIIRFRFNHFSAQPFPVDPDCDDCVAGFTAYKYLTVTIQDCEDCEVEAGTALATEVCFNDADAGINLFTRLTGADGGGTWTYTGYSTTIGGSYTPGVDDPGTLVGSNPVVNFNGYTVGFHKFRYTVTNPEIEDCDDFVDLIVEVTDDCPCEVDAGTATNTEACNEISGTSITLRDHLAGEDAGGIWTFEGYSIDDTTYGAGGTAPGTLTGDNPTVNFNTFILGYYKFKYCVTDADLTDCTDCENLIIHVIACPCEESPGTPHFIETCN